MPISAATTAVMVTPPNKARSRSRQPIRARPISGPAAAITTRIVSSSEGSGAAMQPAARSGQIILEVGRITFQHRNLQGREDFEEARQRQIRHPGGAGHGDRSGAVSERASTDRTAAGSGRPRRSSATTSAVGC